MRQIQEIIENVRVNEPMNHIWYEIISEIKLVRKEQNISQRTLAKQSGVPQKTISRIESGVNIPSFETLGKLMRALHIKPSISFSRDN